MRNKIVFSLFALLCCMILLSSPKPAYASEKEGWVKDSKGNVRYYVENTAVTGLQTIDGETYYFNASGIRKTGWIEIEGEKYYFSTKTGHAIPGKTKVGSYTYFFSETGKRLSGFMTIAGKIYYFNVSDGKMKVNGLKKISGGYYLFGKDGAIITGWKTVSGSTYYFDKETGKARTGLNEIDGKYYFFYATGKRGKGWQTIDGNKYYFGKKTYYALTGLRKVGSYNYFFADDGRMLTGWQEQDGYRYYFSTKTGRAYSGYKAIGKDHYYFSTKTNRMLTGWQTVSGAKRYFIPSTGKMHDSFRKITNGYKVVLPTYNQGKYGYPLGCEGVSAYMALKGLGYVKDMTIHEFMDTQPSGTDPTVGFMGDPRYDRSAEVNLDKRTTIRPEPFQEWMNEYGTTRNISGASIDDIREELKKGHVCVVYVTSGWKEPVWAAYPWGDEVTNNHVLCVVGYRSNGDLLVNDCHNGSSSKTMGEYWVSEARFAGSYEARRFALSVSPAAENENE